MSYNLNCIYDSRQSFYGKAVVTEYEDENKLVKELYSYSTLVAKITKDKKTGLTTYEYLGNFSQTTTRHQKEFFKQNDLSNNELKELFKNEILEK